MSQREHFLPSDKTQIEWLYLNKPNLTPAENT